MTELIQQISDIRLIPVVKIDSAEDAVPLAEALRAGGLNAAEITFRTSCAEESIRRIAEAFPDMLVAAGTVLTEEQADAAIKAGAKFLVSPGLNPRVVAYCKEKGYPIVPGVITPSEVECALSLGLTHVKFFPAEAAGGVKMIKAMSAPYTGVRFMPTGGISEENLASYLSVPAVFACGGSFMVPGKLLSARDFDGIRKLTENAVALLKTIK